MRRALVLAGLLLAAAAANAQAPDLSMAGKWWKRPRVVEELQLSSEQQERLDKIFAKNRRNFIDLKAEVERRGVDVEELLMRKDSDPKKVAAASEAMEQARLRLRKAHTQMLIEMREVLTGEQWHKLVEGLERMREMQRFRRNRGARGGAGAPADVPPRDTPE